MYYADNIRRRVRDLNDVLRRQYTTSCAGRLLNDHRLTIVPHDIVTMYYADSIRRRAGRLFTMYAPDKNIRRRSVRDACLRCTRTPPTRIYDVVLCGTIVLLWQA